VAIKAIAFDLGNTLVHYYEREEFPTVLGEAIRNIYAVLPEIATAPLNEPCRSPWRKTSNSRMQRFVRSQSDSTEFSRRLRRCTPMWWNPPLALSWNRSLVEPKKYNDCDQTFRRLRETGYKLAIASNTPRGSPREP
jgi:FMN phosphatase YigB (HAD superfamily)